MSRLAWAEGQREKDVQPVPGLGAILWMIGCFVVGDGAKRTEE